MASPCWKTRLYRFLASLRAKQGDLPENDRDGHRLSSASISLGGSKAYCTYSTCYPARAWWSIKKKWRITLHFFVHLLALYASLLIKKLLSGVESLPELLGPRQNDALTYSP